MQSLYESPGCAAPSVRGQPRATMTLGPLYTAAAMPLALLAPSPAPHAPCPMPQPHKPQRAHFGDQPARVPAVATAPCCHYVTTTYPPSTQVDEFTELQDQAASDISQLPGSGSVQPDSVVPIATEVRSCQAGVWPQGVGW